MILATSIAVMIVGLVLYIVASTPKPLPEIGRIMFATGLLVALLRFSGVLHLN